MSILSTIHRRHVDVDVKHGNVMYPIVTAVIYVVGLLCTLIISHFPPFADDDDVGQ
jgi:hypothetical protein